MVGIYCTFRRFATVTRVEVQLEKPRHNFEMVMKI